MSAKTSARPANSSRLQASNSASKLKAKSDKELDRLKGSLSERLRQDMERLLAEGTSADIMLVANAERISVHSQILQARLAEFYSSIIQPNITEREAQGNTADLSSLGVDMTELRNLLRAVYAEDNVQPFWNAFWESMKSINSDEPSDCKTTESQIDEESPATEQNQDHPRTITEAAAESQACDLVSDRSQKPVAELEINGLDHGNQTVSSGSALSVEVCEYASLENATPASERRQDGAKQRSEVGSSHQQSEGAQLGSGSDTKDRNGATTSPAINQTKPKTLGSNSSASVKAHDQASKEAETQRQSSDSPSPLPASPCPLGDDLLSIFTTDSSHDVTIRVDGKEIPAHRFMLCARSQYFSAMLEGGWRESSSSVIDISGFSHRGVVIALHFIYGGAYELPDDVIIRDVLYLADMYGLDMLKDVVEFKLRSDYCHFFHKPCSVCLARIPECLVMIAGIDLPDLRQSILSWLVQYLDKAWSEKMFTSLPENLVIQCKDAAIQSLTPQSATHLLLRLDKLLSRLPHVKWKEGIHSTALQVQRVCIQYMATNFISIIWEQTFRKLLVGMNWSKDLIEPVFSNVVPNLTADTANLTFVAVNSLQTEMNEPGDEDKWSRPGWNTDAVSMVKLLHSRCYSYLVSNASLMVQAKGWSSLPSDIRERIKEDGVFIDSRGKAPARKPVLSSSLKGKNKSSSSK